MEFQICCMPSLLWHLWSNFDHGKWPGISANNCSQSLSISPNLYAHKPDIIPTIHSIVGEKITKCPKWWGWSKPALERQWVFTSPPLDRSLEACSQGVVIGTYLSFPQQMVGQTSAWVFPNSLQRTGKFNPVLEVGVWGVGLPGWAEPLPRLD